MDLAHLGIKVSYADIDKAINKLRELERTGKTVQSQVENITVKAKVDTSTQEKTKEIAKQIADGYKAADAATAVLDSELHKLTMSYDKVASAAKSLITRIDILSEKDRIAASSVDNLNAQLQVLKKHANEIGQWRNIEGLNFLLKTAEERLARLQALAKKKLELVKPKTSTELNKITAELKSLERQAQILGETSSVSAREVDKLSARLKYLEKQAGLKNLLRGNKELQDLISRTGQSIENLTGKIRKSENAVQRWWKRFGVVGLGFTAIYQTINLATSALHSLNQVILKGIDLSGELVSTQAKLSMWIEVGTRGAISFQEAMKVSKGIVEALADAALTSTSSLEELATGLDEVSQAGVLITRDMIPKFADLVDFTKMIAESTGSSTKQIRQELQSLMQGQVKAGNLLIRTVKQLQILTDEDIQALKEMQNRQEIIARLSETISSYWREAKEIIISAKPSIAFDKWYNSLTRLVSKAVSLTSEKQGVMNIFGATIYKHIKELNQEIQNMNPEKYQKFLLSLNVGLDYFLKVAEKAVKIVLSMDVSVKGTTLRFKELENFVKGVLTPLTMFYNIAKDINNDLLKLTDTLEDMGIHLVSVHKIVGEAFVYRLLFGKWKTAVIITTLDKIFEYLDKAAGKDKNKYLSLIKEVGQYGLIGGLLYGPEGAITGAMLGTTLKILELLDKIKNTKPKKPSKKEEEEFLRQHGMNITFLSDEDVNHAKKNEDEMQKTVNKYKKLMKQLSDTLKSEKTRADIESLAQKVKESLMTSIEKLIEEKKKLDEVVKTGKITKEEELEYLAKEAESYLGLKSPIEDVMKLLSKSPDTWEANLKALKEKEQATEEFKKHLEELEKYAQQLEETADPLEKFITEFNKLKETQDLVGLTNQAFAEGLLQISKNIIDVTGKENKLREVFKAHAEELKTLPIGEVIEKIKKYYSELEDKQKTWKDGAIDALNEYAKSASDVAKNMETVFTNAFNNLEDALVEFVTTGKASFSDLVNSILADLTRLTIRQTITAPLATALSAGLQGGIGALFGGAGTTASSTIPSAYNNLTLTGGATTSLNVDQFLQGSSTTSTSLSADQFLLGPDYYLGTFAKGDIFLNSSDLSVYRNSIITRPTLFTFASGMGLMGEAGPEAVMPLTRTSSGDLGVKAEVAPVEINIIDQRSANSAPVEVTEQNVDGKKQIRILIKSEFENMIAKGEFDKLFKQSYGLRRRAY